MIATAAQPGFEMSVSARHDGTVEAAYIRLTTARVHRTAEVIEDTLIADYDRDGELVGVEILAPVKISQIAKLVKTPMRRSVTRFIKNAAPSSLIST